MNSHPTWNLDQPTCSDPTAHRGFDGSNEFEHYDWGARRPRWTTPRTDRWQKSTKTGWAAPFDCNEWRGGTHHPLMNAWTRMRSWHGATSGTMVFPRPPVPAWHPPGSGGTGAHRLGPAGSTDSAREAEAA
ncbi:MAG: hypothetical protein CBC35_07605 [Planctomycetes bacterium TMED75]|nr:hypothetical protein [Planctomycetaceae bacterium]OUU92222.1 MAG: hypothetical protein CBC35_07605 [Planctomycetes bacterium TMED75]